MTDKPNWWNILPVPLSKQERRVKDIVQGSDTPISAAKIAKILSEEDGGTEVRRSTPAVAIGRVNRKSGATIIQKTGKGYVDSLKIIEDDQEDSSGS
ncbi:MAG: hypothetical protein WA152_00945 [Microgenomates group bacterium]